MVAVNQSTKTVRILVTSSTKRSADAVVYMETHRRGLEEEFFVVVPENAYREGELWDGHRKGGNERRA